MIGRRGFLGAILALGVAPAVVRASSLMLVRPLLPNLGGMGQRIKPTLVDGEEFYVVTMHPSAMLDLKRDFGAIGDGIADDTAALARALATGGNIYAPNGIYRLTLTVTIGIPTTPLSFNGCGSRFVAQHDDSILRILTEVRDVHITDCHFIERAR